MIRFIHAADIHLDSPMRGIDSALAGIDSKIYRSSTRLALINLINFANKEKVDFVTLGGDNYDGDWDSFQTGLFFLEQMSGLGTIPVVSITGNHDAANKMTLNLKFPRNFKQLDVDSPEVYEVIDGVRVIGQGFKNQKEDRNLVKEYPQLDGRGIKIGLLHTSLDGKEGHGCYAPCTIDDLRSRHYHFWGLGHIHKHSWELPPGDLPILFPGNIQGRHIRETGPKGAWLITMDDHGNMVESHFEPLDVTRWELATIDISPMERLEELWNQCGIELTRLRNLAGERTLATRFEIQGFSDLHYDLHEIKSKKYDEDGIQAQIQSEANTVAQKKIWVEKVKLSTGPPVNEEMNVPAMAYLHEFINEKANSDEWIQKFMASDEITKLKQQVDIFPAHEAAEMAALFDAEFIRGLMHEVPSTLKTHLNSNSLVKDEILKVEDSLS